MIIESRKPKTPRKPPTLLVMKAHALRKSTGSVVRSQSPWRILCRSIVEPDSTSGAAAGNGETDVFGLTAPGAGGDFAADPAGFETPGAGAGAAGFGTAPSGALAGAGSSAGGSPGSAFLRR